MYNKKEGKYLPKALYSCAGLILGLCMLLRATLNPTAVSKDTVHMYLVCHECSHLVVHMCICCQLTTRSQCATTNMPTIKIVCCNNVICCDVAVYRGRSRPLEHDTTRLRTYGFNEQHYSDPSTRHEHSKR